MCVSTNGVIDLITSNNFVCVPPAALYSLNHWIINIWVINYSKTFAFVNEYATTSSNVQNYQNKMPFCRKKIKKKHCLRLYCVVSFTKNNINILYVIEINLVIYLSFTSELMNMNNVLPTKEKWNTQFST